MTATLRAARRAWAPTYDEAARLRYDDDTTTTDEQRRASRAYVARHQQHVSDSAELLQALGLDT